MASRSSVSMTISRPVDVDFTSRSSTRMSVSRSSTCLSVSRPGDSERNLHTSRKSVSRPSVVLGDLEMVADFFTFGSPSTSPSVQDGKRSSKEKADGRRTSFLATQQVDRMPRARALSTGSLTALPAVSSTKVELGERRPTKNSVLKSASKVVLLEPAELPPSPQELEEKLSNSSRASSPKSEPRTPSSRRGRRGAMLRARELPDFRRKTLKKMGLDLMVSGDASGINTTLWAGKDKMRRGDALTSIRNQMSSASSMPNLLDMMEADARWHTGRGDSLWAMCHSV